MVCVSEIYNFLRWKYLEEDIQYISFYLTGHHKSLIKDLISEKLAILWLQFELGITNVLRDQDVGEVPSIDKNIVTASASLCWGTKSPKDITLNWHLGSHLHLPNLRC